MKLQANLLARSIWYFPTEDLNPRGLDLIPVLIGIRNRYQFQKYPSKPDELTGAPDGIQFTRGVFRLGDGQGISIGSLKIYTDGLVADTSHSTTASDEFLEDLLTFLAEAHSLAFSPDMIRKKDHRSELAVTSEIDLETINGKFKEFARLLADSTPGSPMYTATGIRFETDPAFPNQQARFSFERRDGHPFEHKRYFSSALMGTDEHWRLLEIFEQLMSV